MKKAIVSIVIGDQYRAFWQQHGERSWREYAAKHQYDIIIIDQPIRPLDGTRSIHWQKLLTLELEHVKAYDRVVWLDSDIVINTAQAPSIVEQVPEDKIGVALFGDLVDQLQPLVLERLAQAFHECGGSLSELKAFWPNYYKHAGLDADPNQRFNTGVLVMTPTIHGPFLRGIYEKYLKNAFDYEQTYLNYEMLQANAHHILDGRFNLQVGDAILKHYPFMFFLDQEAGTLVKNELFSFLAKLTLLTIYDNNYFLHYCGVRWQAPLLTEALQFFGERNFRALSRSLFWPRDALPS